MKDHNKFVTFFDVKPENKEYKKQNEFSIAKDKYDVNYVINLCKQIIQKCENQKFNSSDLRFSLQQSLKTLVAEIEVQKYQSNGPKTFRCDNCNEMYFTMPNKTNVNCPHCNNIKKLSPLQ